MRPGLFEALQYNKNQATKRQNSQTNIFCVYQHPDWIAWQLEVSTYYEFDTYPFALIGYRKITSLHTSLYDSQKILLDVYF